MKNYSNEIFFFFFGFSSKAKSSCNAFVYLVRFFCFCCCFCFNVWVCAVAQQVIVPADWWSPYGGGRRELHKVPHMGTSHAHSSKTKSNQQLPPNQPKTVCTQTRYRKNMSQNGIRVSIQHQPKEHPTTFAGSPAKLQCSLHAKIKKNVCVCICACIYVYACVYVYVHVCLCMCVNVYMYAYVVLCVYIWSQTCWFYLEIFVSNQNSKYWGFYEIKSI